MPAAELVLCLALAAAETYSDPFAAYAAGAYDQALKLFLDAQVERPKDPRLALDAGNTYYRLGDFQNAERAFAQAAASDDPALRARATYNRGNAAFRLNDLNAAKQHYQATLQLDPKDEDARANLALVERRIEEQKQQQQQQQQQDGQQQQNQDQQQQQEGQQQDQGQQQQQQEAQQQQPGQQQDAQSAPQGDADRDGLANAQEDKNQNGKQDPGETSAQNADSDGDGTPDGQDAQPLQASAATPGQPGEQLSRDEAERYLLQLQEKRPRRGPTKGKARPTGGKDW